jgi:hypothetical protein
MAFPSKDHAGVIGTAGTSHVYRLAEFAVPTVSLALLKAESEMPFRSIPHSQLFEAVMGGQFRFLPSGTRGVQDLRVAYNRAEERRPRSPIEDLGRQCSE